MKIFGWRIGVWYQNKRFWVSIPYTIRLDEILICLKEQYPVEKQRGDDK